MGHYYAEMACSICGNIHCTCPPKPDTTDHQWVIDDELNVVYSIDYQKALQKKGDQLAFFKRTYKKHYDHKDEAQEEADHLKFLKTLPSDKEKVEMYEALLHDIELFADETMDGEKVRKLIGNICSWSYAHRSGNGDISEDARLDRINKAFQKLRAI